MYSKELEELIESVLADGVITDQERRALRKRAQASGEDPDEVMIVVEGRLAKMRKSASPVKNGNMVKCPGCGAPVRAGALICEECGYEFHNVSANKAAEKFTEELKRLRGGNSLKAFFSDKVETFISDYPIPNAVDDVLELMALARQKADRHGDTEAKAYWTLFSRCIDKARSAGLAADPRFTQFFEFYKKHGKKKDVGLMIVGLFFLVFFVVFFIWFGYMMYDNSKTKARIETSIDTQLDSLSTVIDGLPFPTKENYQECAYRIMKLAWKPVNCQYSDGEGGDEVRALSEKQEAAIKSFAKKKNAYIRLLNGLHVADSIPEE